LGISGARGDEAEGEAEHGETTDKLHSDISGSVPSDGNTSTNASHGWRVDDTRGLSSQSLIGSWAIFRRWLYRTHRVLEDSP